MTGTGANPDDGQTPEPLPTPHLSESTADQRDALRSHQPALDDFSSEWLKISARVSLS
ncbi:uncharacterized protein METZ01_LOCUS123860 [marine metagenome]|uniref:Uncharacterized protein n=1 Tax=marine metagenome TaxID=408172 RepID=A0A381Y1N3_9ZZZZ